jgi:outer membrane protein OmpA-like peptidoglycan-associated protein
MPGVRFQVNSARLTENARHQLDVLGSVLSKHASSDGKFVIGGHTDATGNDAYNKKLSQRRAKAVVEFLVSQHRIARSMFIPVGYGESRLIAGHSPEDPAHRRVEVVNIGVAG